MAGRASLFARESDHAFKDRRIDGGDQLVSSRRIATCLATIPLAIVEDSTQNPSFAMITMGHVDLFPPFGPTLSRFNHSPLR
jgi:hypothetical protein